MEEPFCCPRCNCKRIWRDGFRQSGDNGQSIQRWLCTSCGFRFSESNRNLSEGSEHVLRIDRQSLRPNDAIALSCQVGASQARRAKNLEEEATAKNRLSTAATTTGIATIKGMILKQAWWLQKENRKESTIAFRNRLLNTLVKQGVDLTDPDKVKEAVSSMKRTEGTKLQYIAAYKVFATANGIIWEPPKCEQVEKQPFIPTEQELDALIAAAGNKTAPLLQLLKETAMRIGEAYSLSWTDLDNERNIITLNKPEKGSRTRTFKVTVKLMSMLQRLPKKSEKIFEGTPRNKSGEFYQFRKRVANTLQNPRLLKITFHTFRHWKATMLAHQTKDPFYVQGFLGHKSILNTQKYIHLSNTLFTGENDEFHAKVAKNVDEACKLVETGFEYVTTIENVQIYRKRK